MGSNPIISTTLFRYDMLTAMGDVMRTAYKRGWITTRDGNISVMMTERDILYITPSGWRKTILHPEHLVRIKTNGDLLKLKDGQNASGELEMHWLLQKSYGKTRAVVHLHPTYTIAAMLRGFDLQKLSNHFPELSRYTRVGKTVPILPVTSPELAVATAQSFQVDRKGKLACDIVGQKAHGVCAVAKNPWDAFEHIERLEHICQITLASGVNPSFFAKTNPPERNIESSII